MPNEKEENTIKKRPVPFYSLFKFSSKSDRLLMFVGVISGLASGAGSPLVVITVSQLIGLFVERESSIHGERCNNGTLEELGNLSALMHIIPRTSDSPSDDAFKSIFLQDCTALVIRVACIGSIMIVICYSTVFTFIWAAENQILRMRKRFMASVLHQEQGWFDTNAIGDFANIVSSDLIKIQEAIGEKSGMCIYLFATTVISLITAFIQDWKLSLVAMSSVPIMTLTSFIVAKVQAKISVDEVAAYGAAGTVAEEVLSSIRTVAAFGGEAKEIKRYAGELKTAKANGIKRVILSGVGQAMLWLCIYGAFAITFWYGTTLIIESRCKKDEYRISTVFAVCFCIYMGTMTMGQLTPFFEIFAVARASASKIFKVINRVAVIDSSSKEGIRSDRFRGEIKIADVYFSYPARADVQVLEGFSLEVVPGETVALVGSSGCGKSTVIQLLQRFYDVDKGEVLIDGVNIKKYNTGWFRDNIGVVGQEPVLFNTTIYENIRYGFQSADKDDIIQSAKAANADDFISKMPKGYDTIVGERGVQLSGGQKQRIAIARALVRNPKILLLDEATSALDTESESVVQAALDEATKGRTTIIVAHRLSTIRNANKIIVLNKGRVVEIGTDEELMNKEGIYYNLVRAQALEKEVEQAVFNDLDEPDPIELDPSHTTKEQVEYPDSKDESQAKYLHPENISIEISKESTKTKQLENLTGSLTGNLLKVALPEWGYILVGCVSSLILGLALPAYGVVMGDVLQAMSSRPESIREETNFYCIVFVAMGVLYAAAQFLQACMFAVSGERLTARLRTMVFTNMIRQEISWFDLDENSPGALSSKLSSEASHVQGATGTRLSTIVQSIVAAAGSVALALYYDYRVGLVTFGFCFITFGTVFFEQRIVSGQILNENDALESSTKTAVEAISYIRTVASLHIEDIFLAKYCTLLSEPHRKARTRTYFRGLSFGFSRGIPQIAYGTALYYGSTLVADDTLKFGDLFKVVEGICCACIFISHAVAFAPDVQKAKIAAKAIMKLLDKKSKLDPLTTKGTKLESLKGEVQFNEVHFSYESRSSQKILRGIGFTARPGETVALVGPSGCGKSTCIQLMQRFYSHSEGSISLDQMVLPEMDIRWLRSQLGIVSQEPVLFGYSIAENIAYGDNSRNASMEDIIEAAKKANIHDFIATLPQGYETRLGDHGTQLSGGQKQRIAIARALLRNPKILLLDEATSALDSESEKVVQAALDNASEGRTCIVIAHRLSTIQNADQILVLHKGIIIEKGTHRELLSKEGFYHKLYTIQSTVK